MEEKVKVNTQLLAAAIEQISKALAGVNRQMLEIEQISGTLAQTWEGGGEHAYQKELVRDYQKLANRCRLIKDYMMALEQALETYDATGNQVDRLIAEIVI